MTCRFCKSSSNEMHVTLYGVNICEKCHLILKKHNIKDDLENFVKRIQEHSDHLKSIAPKKIRTYRNFYIRDGFHTYCIPRNVFDKENMVIKSETEEAIKLKSFLFKLISYFAPVLCRKLLKKDVQNIIEKELIENIEKARTAKIERDKEQARKMEIQISKYIERKMLAKYPSKYRRIIEYVKNENILLYEYFLDEYPPDWNYRAKIIKERDGNTCQKCGSRIDLCVHHKIPVRKPEYFALTRYSFTEKRLERSRLRKGDHFPNNLITLCKECHLKEHPEVLAKINSAKEARVSQ